MKTHKNQLINPIPMKYADLHLHTYFSDGAYSPRQVVLDSFLLIGPDGAMAISDHDNIKGYRQAKQTAKHMGVKLLSGIEFSTPKYHILGYDFDTENRALNELIEYSFECQNNIAKARIQKLNELGMPVTYEKVRRYFPESRVGEVNIAITCLRDEECRKHTTLRTFRQICDFYFLKGKPAKEIGEMPQVTAQEAAAGIHIASGKVFIAHPFKDVKNMPELDDISLDGIEVQPTFGDSNKPFIEYAQSKGLLISYGSDYHGMSICNRPLLKQENNLVQEFWK